MKLSEGFEIDDNELDSLRDKSIAPEALRIFYGAILKLSTAEEDTVRDIFEEADAKLRQIYADSPSFATDFHRVDGQLLRCFNQKVKELRGVPILSAEGQLSASEELEYESMKDKELRTIAKGIYCLGKTKMVATNDVKSLLDQRDAIATELSAVYDNSWAYDDLGKWIFMLDLYLKRLADVGKSY